MKCIELFESEFLTDKDEIIKRIRKSFLDFDPSKLRIDSDGLVYDGDLFLKQNGSKIKVQINKITGWFNCNTTNITGLEKCPQIIGGYFSCHGTNITSLKFCPQSVGNKFYCYDIKITDPKEYRYALYCDIGVKFNSGNADIDDIINTYGGSGNRKHWAYAINLLGKVQL